MSLENRKRQKIVNVRKSLGNRELIVNVRKSFENR